MGSFVTFIGYLMHLFDWLPTAWLPLIRIVFLIFFVWSILRLIAAILDALPFL